MVALSLVKELGPVIGGLLFASRAGSAITAEIGLMKATEQLSAMEMMAVDPIARVVAPRFWAGVISMPLLAALFSAFGIFGGYLIGVRVIGIDAGAFWGQMQARRQVLAGHHQRHHQEHRLRRRSLADRGLRRLRRQADGGRRVERDDENGGDFVAGDTRARFCADCVHVQGSRSMNRAAIDLWVGVFVAIGLGAILFLALKVGNLLTLDQHAQLSGRGELR